MFKNPTFWNKKQWVNYILIPFSWLWMRLGRWKSNRVIPERVSVPVICVGNIVMGGAGKTPTVIALVEILKSLGHNPHILSRGYGAYIRDVIRVNPEKHTYLQVGDEPLLLAKAAPTWAGPNRVLSAKKAIEAGASVLVMDDGLQNDSLVKDLSFLVVDAVQGMGNGMVFPAGPLREPIQTGVKKAQAMIVIGGKNPLPKQKLPKFYANVHPKKHVVGQKVIAFCGMGCPEKFRLTLVEQGYNVVEFVTFADHHPYTIPDMIHLNRLSSQHNIPLITTTKDWLRVPNSYREMIDVLPISLIFVEPKAIESLIISYIDTPNTSLSKLSI